MEESVDVLETLRRYSDSTSCINHLVHPNQIIFTDNKCHTEHVQIKIVLM